MTVMNQSGFSPFLSLLRRKVFLSAGGVLFLSLFLFSCSSKDEEGIDPGEDHSSDEEAYDELTEKDLIQEVASAEFDYSATGGKIFFSGYEWDVKSSVNSSIGPGPNYFSMSKENVWVDKNGSLHLKITKRNDKWFVSSVSLTEPQGFGRYIVYVSSETELLDPNIVAGLFLYKTDDQEVDIEFSKWGQEKNRNTQFAIQPGDRAGNKNRFDVWTEGYKTTHFIDWEKDSIRFGSYKGVTLHPKEENIFSTWTYKGKDNPGETGEKFIINFWLFRGNPPINQEDAELVIDSIRIIKHTD